MCGWQIEETNQDVYFIFSKRRKPLECSQKVGVKKKHRTSSGLSAFLRVAVVIKSGWALTKEVNKTTMEQNNYIHFPLLTVGEAAKYLGVGRKVICELIEFDQLRLRSVRENRAVLIEKRSLDSFRQSGILT